MTEQERARNEAYLVDSMGEMRYCDSLVQQLDDRAHRRLCGKLYGPERRARYLLDCRRLQQFQSEFPKGLPPC